MVILAELISKTDTQGTNIVGNALKATQRQNEAFLHTFVLAGPKAIPANRPSLFVIQGEQALCKALPKLEVVGSEDATTCVIIVIVGENGVAYVSHVDEASCTEPLGEAIERCTNAGNTPAKVYIAGGYVGSVPDSVLRNLFQNSQGKETLVHLELFCCGSVIMGQDGCPKTRALAVDLLTGTPFPFTFENRGPEISRRHAARSLLDNDLTHVVNDTGELILPVLPVRLDPMAKYYYTTMLDLARNSATAFLQQYSTSPLHESDLFVPDMIGMLEFMTVMNEKTLPEIRYCMCDSTWMPT